MSFTESIKSAFSNYAVFKGRASRPAFWYFYLFTAIVAFVLIGLQAAMASSNFAPVIAIVIPIWSLAVLLPTIGLVIRRLHDTDRSGWWILVGFVPLVGFLILIVFLAMPGTPGDNKYGSPQMGTPAASRS